MTLSAPTLLSGSSSSTDSATYNTASVNPPAGSRLLVWVCSGKASNLAEAPTGVSHANIGALTKVLEIASGNSNVVLTAWTGVGTGTGGVITITHANAMGNCLWQIETFTSDVATPTVKQFQTLAIAATGSQGATLDDPRASGSCVVGAFAYNSSSDVPTVGSGFTAIGSRLTQSSPVAALWSEYDNTSPPAQAPFTFGGTASKALGVVEIADGVVPSGPALTVWNGSAEVPATLTIWNGTSEVPATLEIAP